MWVARNGWTSKDPQEMKHNIVKIMDDLSQANFNAVVFQVRGEAETLYPSTLEPWSALLDRKDPGYDPAKLAIEEAHKRGMQFHAYVNPMPMYPARGEPPPKGLTPEHLWYLHGPDTAEPWLCQDENGQIMGGRPSEYWYMTPGIPQVQEYLRKVMMDLVRRYDIDGLHLDRIRYPDPKYSHDPVSVERFYGRGNPNHREWADWQREQLDKLVNDLKAEIMAEKPSVVLSCAAWGIYNRYNIEGYSTFSSGYHDYYQDTWNWVRLGAMDYLMPMIYWDIPDKKPNYDELVDDFIKGIGADHLVGGQSSYRGERAHENVDEINYTRKAGAVGTVIFSYSARRTSDSLSLLREEVYQQKAPVPDLAWKKNPRFGIILGKVTDEEGQPLTDAWVSLVAERPVQRGRGFRGGGGGSGPSQTWPSGSDGRFAFLNVTTDTVRLRIEYPGAQTIETEPFAVSAGEVHKVDVAVKGAKEARSQVFFDIMRPSDKQQVSDKVVHFLGRTQPTTKISINGHDASVYGTGAFVLDNQPLEMGENVFTITATDASSRTTTRSFTVIRREQADRGMQRGEGAPESAIVEPAGDVILLPGDTLTIRASGPTSATVTARCWKKVKVALDEVSAGNYLGTYRVPG
ncbi:MAG: family 10 glycosylhydrolase, partial [bacterium]